MSGCDCTLNSMGLVRMCGSVNTSFSAMALDSVAQFLKDSNSILIIIIIVINLFKKRFIALYLGRKKQQQQNDLTALHNVTIQIMERNNHRNQHKDKDATILNAVSGKCEAIPRATVSQSCTWQGPSEVGCSSWRRIVL